MPQQTLKSGQDVTSLMSGADVTSLFDQPSSATASTATPSAHPMLSAAADFAGGVLSNVNPIEIAKGIYGSLAHPIDTIEGLGKAQLEQFSKGKAAYDQGRYSEAIGHAMAGILPVLGPQAADIGEAIGSGQDTAKNLGKATGFLATVAAPSVVKGASEGTRTLMGDKLSAALDRRIPETVADVIAPKAGPNKIRFGNMAADVAPRLASEPGMGALSREGLAVKVGDKFDAAAANLDAVSDARNAAKPIVTAPIISDLKAERAKLTAKAVPGSLVTPVQGASPSGLVKVPVAQAIGKDVVPAPNAGRVAQIDKAIQEIQALGPVAHYDAIKTIRQAYDGPAKVKYSPAMSPDYLAKQGEASGAADVTGVLRKHLAGSDPETAVANKEYSYWRKANDVLQAAQEIDRVRPKVGRTIAARLGGAAVGGAEGGTAGAFFGALMGGAIEHGLSAMSEGRKIIMARAMSDLSDALKTGDVSKIEGAVGKFRALSLAASAASKAKDQQ